MGEQRRAGRVGMQHAGAMQFPGIWSRGRCDAAVANLLEQVCRGKLPACHPLGSLAVCAGREPGLRCEGKQKKREGEKGEKEEERAERRRDNVRGREGGGEATCEGNGEFLFVLPVFVPQGGFELLPNMTVNYFNLYFSPQSP